jgi:hypothetical protein
MGVHSGKFGVVDGVATVKNWSISDEQDSVRFVASNTAFGTGTNRGKESWNGSFQCFKAVPDAMPGDLITFAGYTAPNDNVSGNGVRYDGSAMVKQVQVNWNWGTAELLHSQVDFDGHLALVPTVGAQLLDADPALVKGPQCAVIKYSADLTTWTELPNLLTAQLTITSALKPYANSTTVVTDSGVCRLWTGQSAGPLDIQVAITQQDNLRSVFKKGDQLGLRLFVNATEYYELVYARVKNFTGISVNVDTGEIIQQTINFDMDAIKAADGTLGHFKLPDTTTWWPAA